MCNTDTGTGISLSVRYIISVTGVLYDNNVLLRALFVIRNEYRSFFFAGEQGGDLVRSISGGDGHLLPDGQRGHQPGHCSPHAR